MGGLTKEKSGRQHLGQVVKAYISTDKPCWEQAPLDMRWRKRHHLCDILPKHLPPQATLNSSLIMTKIWDQHKWRDSLQNTWDISMSRKTREEEKLSQPRGDQRDRTMKCNVGSWVGPQTRGRTLAGKKSEHPIKSRVYSTVMKPRWFLNFNKYTMVMNGVNLRENWQRGRWELCAVLATFL